MSDEIKDELAASAGDYPTEIQSDPVPAGGNERPTPETDAAKCEMRIEMTDSRCYGVPADFARRLERERDEARGRADSKHGSWMNELKRLVEVEKERNEAREEAQRAWGYIFMIRDMMGMQTPGDGFVEFLQAMKQERDSLRTKLAAATRDIEELRGKGENSCPTWSELQDALQVQRQATERNAQILQAAEHQIKLHETSDLAEITELQDKLAAAEQELFASAKALTQSEALELSKRYQIVEIEDKLTAVVAQRDEASRQLIESHDEIEARTVELAAAEQRCKELAEAADDLLLHLSPTVISHEQEARHNEGLCGMPQGPCTCVVCTRYRMHSEVVRAARKTGEQG